MSLRHRSDALKVVVQSGVLARDYTDTNYIYICVCVCDEEICRDGV